MKMAHVYLKVKFRHEFLMVEAVVQKVKGLIVFIVLVVDFF